VRTSALYLVILAQAAFIGASAPSRAVPIVLSDWTVVQYDLPASGQPDANWVLTDGDTAVTQAINADASILLSDFDAVSTAIVGNWEVETSADNDYTGFVFGYQGRANYYLFDWRKTSQGSHASVCGAADVGMALKVVDVAGGGDPSCRDLWDTHGFGTGNITLLLENDIPWRDSIAYTFMLDFTPGSFAIRVLEGDTLLQQWEVQDATYTSGAFGFYNYSQARVSYRGFDVAPIPEPSTVLLLAPGLAALAMARKRRPL
jgi:hypothetical protein